MTAIIIGQIFEERRRQALRGFDAAHDDAHEDGALLEYAGQYVREFAASSDRSALVKAAALVVAEIERFDRAELAATKAAEKIYRTARPFNHDEYLAKLTPEQAQSRKKFRKAIRRYLRAMQVNEKVGQRIEDALDPINYQHD